MIQITVKSGKEKMKILLPQSHELTYAQFCDMQFYTGRIFKFISTHIEQDTFDDYMGQYIALIAECLSELTGSPIRAFYELELGDDEKHFKQLTDFYKGKHNLEEVKHTLYGLLNIALNEVFKYKPKVYYNEQDCAFEYKGEKFTIPFFLKDALSGEKINPKIKAGQAIEINEIQRLYRQKIDSLTEESETREQDLIYQRDLFCIALLAKREGEEVPDNLTDMDVFINARAKMLDGLPMNIGRDVLFFLTSSSEILKVMKEINSFTNRQNKSVQLT